jgi:multicomponent K+:H+ antiporter subunit A
MRDVLIATAIGTGVGVFALAAVNHRPAPTTIATWHIDNALPEIGVDDVVGAIVTDFRGMDTIIEITVFSVAALGVLTLMSQPMRGSRLPVETLKTLRGLKRIVLRRHDEVDANPDTAHLDIAEDAKEEAPLVVSTFSTPLTRTIAQFVLPFAFLVGLVQLLYGGDQPGDGFTAGVISGLGVALWYVVFGYHEARERLGWLNSRRLIGAGLTLVLANAAFPLLLGQPFLAHLSFDQIALPANLHLSSTLVYETGIFITVLGGVSMIMESIAYPREVETV